jgi:cation diffusion facilitator family transporter
VAATADGTDVARARAGAVRRVLLAILGLNLVVFAAKAAYGLWSGSLAISSDAMHSLADAGANVIGLVVLHFAEAPPDDKHPYGHRKLEMVAAAAIGVTVAMVALRFAWDAIDALASGEGPPETSLLGFVVIGGTWVINLVVAAYEARRARDLDSAYLAADAAHTASDLVVTAGVAVSFTATFFGVRWADPVGALLIIVFIGRIAWRIIGANLTVLVDRVVIDPDRVRAVVRSVDGALDCHRVRSRGTEGAAQVDLHLLLEGEITLREAHETAHQVEEKLRRLIPEIVDVTIHMEPSDDPEEGL